MEAELASWLRQFDWGHLWTALTTARPVGPHSPIDMMKRVERAWAKVEANRPEVMNWHATRRVPRYEV